MNVILSDDFWWDRTKLAKNSGFFRFNEIEENGEIKPKKVTRRAEKRLRAELDEKYLNDEND